jgi:hypothetical protein
MKEAGVIDQSIFSFYMNLKNDSSKVTFGGYDQEKFAAEGTELVFHNINTTSEEWQITL